VRIDRLSKVEQPSAMEWWRAVGVTMLKPVCRSCGCDVLREVGSEFSCWDSLEGVCAELDDFSECPRCSVGMVPF